MKVEARQEHMQLSEHFEQRGHAEMSGDDVVQLLQLFEQQVYQARLSLRTSFKRDLLVRNCFL